MTLEAVLAHTPLDGLRGQTRVEVLRSAAHGALGRCAQRAGARLGVLEHDQRGAPRPQGGWFWSVSHTSDGPSGWVAAVLARAPVGIDLEYVGPRREELVARVLDARERQWVGDGVRGFASAWTAKEAVLKKLGVGLTELSLCRIVGRSATGLTLAHSDELHAVEQVDFQATICSVSADDVDARVRWTREMDTGVRLEDCA
jgi:phosphopantetheinyl transferase